MKKTSRHPDAKVYSYIRFSSGEQKMGDSERRQLEGAKKFAEQRGLTLDHSLDLMDRGVSGFSGKHRKQGALGTFLELVKEGRIAAGSILLVENLDRLSREVPFDTLSEIIMPILAGDITISTLMPPDEFTKESLNDFRFYELIAHIKRAHAESEIKSKRGQANWEQKRKRGREGKLFTRKCPDWLHCPNGLEEFQVREGAAETLRLIFQMKLDGHGTRSIAKHLNQESGWQRPNGWHASYVKRILSNPAVIGEYQPMKGVEGERVPDGEPFTDCFPQVIDPVIFQRVQKMISQQPKSGGQNGKYNNLFSHLVKCPYCDGSMNFVNKTKSGKSKPYFYLICTNAQRGRGCEHVSIRYDEVEALILENCSKLDPEAVLPAPDEQAQKRKQLAEQIAGCEAEVYATEKRIKNLTEAIAEADDKGVRKTLSTSLAEQQTKQVEQEKRLVELRKELRQAETSVNNVKQWKRDLQKLRGELSSGNPDIRRRMKNHLKQLVSKIEVFTKGHPEETIGLTDYRSNPDLTAGDNLLEMQGFLAFLSRRLNSKEGRFLRVWWKSGTSVDLVPEGSLASGLKLSGNKWEHVHPDYRSLQDEYENSIQ